jgi:hypothetical protein
VLCGVFCFVLLCFALFLQFWDLYSGPCTCQAGAHHLKCTSDLKQLYFLS